MATKKNTPPRTRAEVDLKALYERHDIAEDKITEAERHARLAQQCVDELYEHFDMEHEHQLGAIEALIEKSRALMSEALAVLEGKKLGGAA